MAKLTAYGRTEVVRVSKEWNHSPEKDENVSWERFTLSFLSDGSVLRKHDVLFRARLCDGSEHRHSYGWKKYKRTKPGVTREQIIAAWCTGPAPWTLET